MNRPASARGRIESPAAWVQEIFSLLCGPRNAPAWKRPHVKRTVCLAAAGTTDGRSRSAGIICGYNAEVTIPVILDVLHEELRWIGVFLDRCAFQLRSSRQVISFRLGRPARQPRYENGLSPLGRVSAALIGPRRSAASRGARRSSPSDATLLLLFCPHPCGEGTIVMRWEQVASVHR